ncbi:MAG: mucoidy inhibitor MuiA family protein [Candidatus Omnitrophica bacterium]|jgi:uncharacterized protein (TIGR02231 family)|nr:mucoidy inhibitor MuiA family protein [Candidatus Omnitrophota bacterium]MDD5660851.1 mucoidy inhibitor MuiA family protein [Candidatus Omnitrophota bacterium]
MRKTKFLIFLLFSAVFLYSSLYAEEIQAQSRIQDVTIFSGNALIGRVASLKLNTGEHQVIFSGLIPDIDDNSLKASGAGSADVRILGAQVVTQFLEGPADEKVKYLQDALQQVRDEIRKLEDKKNVLKEEKVFLDSIKLFSQAQLPKDLVTKMPQANELENTLKFLSAKLIDNFSQNLEADIKIRQLNKKGQALSEELSGLIGAQRKQKKSIIVSLEVLKPGDLQLVLSYVARGAYWYPIYDARVNFDRSEVELISQAVAKQNTGENWQDVAVTLSTAKVNLSARMPEIKSWFIRPVSPRFYGQERSKKLESKVVPMAADQELFLESGQLGSTSGVQEAGYEYAQAQEQGVSVVYQIKRPANIKSDGSEYKLPVSSQALKSKFEYSCYPRLSNYAYLRSKVSNAADLQLIAGRVNIFLDGGFVGFSNIDNIAPGEEFDLYLGIDENVKVKRELVEKKTDDILIAGIPSPTKKTTFKYKISVENYKNKKIKMSIFDNIPVSQDEKIRVNLGKVSLEPKEKDWKDKTGLWRWELELEPKAKQEIFIAYSIEQPRNLEIEGI